MNDIIENYIVPSWDETFMKTVYITAERSKDPRTKIGAILVKERKMISHGFNGFPMGVNDDKERYNNKESKYDFICHAEDNSILAAARFGISTIGTTLYSQGIPCKECCKSAIQGGIKEIVIHKQWPNLIHSENWVKSIQISKIMLNEANIRIRIFDKILGLKGYLDGKILYI